MTDKADDVVEKKLDTGDKGARELGDKLREDARGGSDVKIPPGDLAKYGVTHMKTGEGTDYNTVNDYPNGVKMTRMEGYDLKPGQSYSLEPPPGGTRTEIKGGKEVYMDSEGKEHVKGPAPEGLKEGTVIARDADGKIQAALDPDKTLHVHTKHGEFTETKDGKVSFKSSDGTTNWESLHHTGEVPRGKYGDYGVSAHGNVTRFPNGVEYDKATHAPRIPSEHSQNFREDVREDGTRVGYDGDKVLYTRDGKGIHVATADGVITQGPNGKITFESNKDKKVASLPTLHISD